MNTWTSEYVSTLLVENKVPFASHNNVRGMALLPLSSVLGSLVTFLVEAGIACIEISRQNLSSKGASGGTVSLVE